jgi:hypothetical protein
LWLTGAGGLLVAVPYMRVALSLGHATHTATLDAYGDSIEDDKTTPARCQPPRATSYSF